MKWTWFRRLEGLDALQFMLTFATWLELPYFFTPLRQGIVIGLFVALLPAMLRNRSFVYALCAVLGIVSAAGAEQRAGTHPVGFWLTQVIVAIWVVLAVAALFQRPGAAAEPAPTH